jgi:hypothetical protein
MGIATPVAIIIILLIVGVFVGLIFLWLKWAYISLGDSMLGLNKHMSEDPV